MKRRERGAPHGDLLGALAAGAVVLVFCLLLLWHNPYLFFNDDYEISILPVFADVARSWSEGHWPLLSPYSWVCSNLAGEYQYGTFSLFVNAAVVLIWKFPLAFWHQAAALSITHLFVLAMGAYMLARGRHLSPPLSIMVGLVAAVNGWMICWGASDWFGSLAAFTWLPWSWWALEKAVRAEGPRWRALLPAPFIYLLLAGGFPYTILMLVVVTTWLALQAVVKFRDWRAVQRIALGCILGLAFSAPAWLSLLEYAPGARRSVENFLPRQWLVPISALPGLVLPAWTVKWRQFEEAVGPHAALELACGLAPVAILAAAFVRLRRKLVHLLRWELGLAALIFLLASVPMAGLFRFSFRWLPLFHLVFALTAAEAFERCTRKRSEGREWFLGNPGALACLLTLLVWLAMASFGLTTKNSNLHLPFLFFCVGVLWWLGDTFLNRLTSQSFPPLVAFVTLLMTYIAFDPHPTVAKYWFDESLNRAAPLDSDRLYLSLYPAPQAWYSADMTGAPFGAVVRPGSTSMFGAVHLINGYSPVGPAGVTRLLDFGTHGHINPARVREVVLPEAGPAGLLAQLGIDGIIVAREFELPAPLPNEWKLAHSEWEGDVYHRVDRLPHVHVVREKGFADAAVRMVENSRHKVIAEISPEDDSRPVRLTFSRPYFPGYHATMNGRSLPVSSFQGLTPWVELSAGTRGRVELVYRPRAATLGGYVAALTALGTVGILTLKKNGRRAAAATSSPVSKELLS